MKAILFKEHSESFQPVSTEHQGKLTLKKHNIQKFAAPELKKGELAKIRQQLNVSQAVFAFYLRINKRTLENWEQGRAKPNAQAAVLIKMVEKYPDTIERLISI
jgi:putative transcriptional regulator